jgi:hypothetical protein
MPEDTSAQVNLFLIAAVWTAIGAVVAAMLGFGLLKAPAVTRGAIKYGATIGARTGFIIAPAVVIVAALLLRFQGLVETALLDPVVSEHKWAHFLDAWRTTGESVDAITWALLVWLPVNALELLAWLMRTLGAATVAVIYLVLLGGASVIWLRKRWRWPTFLVLGIGVFYLAMPFLSFEVMRDEAFYLLLWTVVVVGIVFGIPTTILGALTPLWRQFEQDRQVWVIIATGMGVLLALTVALRLFFPDLVSRFQIPWFWILAFSVLSFVVASFFRRGDAIVDHWPFTALLVALMIGSITALSATFVSVWAQFNVLNSSFTAGASSLGAYVCLSDYQWELFAAQLLAPDKARERIEGIRSKLQAQLAPPGPYECTSKDIVKCNVEDLLIQSFSQVCRPEWEMMSKRLDQHIAAAAVKAQWAKEGISQRIEIAVAGSFGFWMTLVLLATYRRFGRDPSVKAAISGESH